MLAYFLIHSDWIRFSYQSVIIWQVLCNQNQTTSLNISVICSNHTLKPMLPCQLHSTPTHHHCLPTYMFKPFQPAILQISYSFPMSAGNFCLTLDFTAASHVHLSSSVVDDSFIFEPISTSSLPCAMLHLTKLLILLLNDLRSAAKT